MAQTLNLAEVSHVKEILETNLLSLGSSVDSSELANLDINILTGIENKDVIFRYKGNEANARRYNQSKKINAKIGSFDERTLTVNPIYTRNVDNLINYKEKNVPGETSILGISEIDPLLLACPVTARRLSEMARQFGNQNVRNFIFGDVDNESVSGMGAYSCYDGLNAQFEALMTANKMSASLGNYYKLNIANSEIDKTAIAALSSKNYDAIAVACYEEFDKFIDAWDEDLADEDRINIMLSRRFYNLILKGGATKYGTDLQKILAMGEGGVTQLFGRENIALKPTKLMGQGVAMTAYVPGIFDLGTDLTNPGDPSSAYVKIGENTSEDMNEIVMQMQVMLGTRVNIYESSHLCVAQDKNAKFNTPKTLKEEVEVTDRDEIAALKTRLAALETAAGA